MRASRAIASTSRASSHVPGVVAVLSALASNGRALHSRVVAICDPALSRTEEMKQVDRRWEHAAPRTSCMPAACGVFGSALVDSGQTFRVQ